MNYLLLFNQFAHMLQTPKKYIHSFWQRDATSRLSMKPTLAPASQKCNLIFCKFKESQTKVVFVFTQNTLYDRRRRESSNSIQKAAAHDKTQTADVWTFNRTFVEDTVWRTNSPHDSWRTANKHCSVCVCVSWHKQTPQLCDDRKIVVKYLLLNPVDQPPFRWRCF